MINAVKYLVALVLFAHTTEAIRSTARLTQENEGSSDPAINPSRTWPGGSMRTKQMNYICRPSAARTGPGNAQRFSSGLIQWQETNEEVLSPISPIGPPTIDQGNQPIFTNTPIVNYKLERLSDRGSPSLERVSVLFAFGNRSGNRSAGMNLRTCTLGADIIPAFAGTSLVVDGEASEIAIEFHGESAYRRSLDGTFFELRSDDGFYAIVQD